jgi:hypothetical protein
MAGRAELEPATGKPQVVEAEGACAETVGRGATGGHMDHRGGSERAVDRAGDTLVEGLRTELMAATAQLDEPALRALLAVARSMARTP